MNNKPSLFRVFGQNRFASSTSPRIKAAALGLTFAISGLLVGLDQKTGNTFLRQSQPEAQTHAETALARHFTPLPDARSSTTSDGAA